MTGLVAGAGLKLFAGGILERLKSAAKWLFLHPAWLAALAAAAFALLQWQEARHWHKQSDRWQGLFGQEKAAFAGTVANVRAAEAAAQKANDRHVEQVEATQNQKTQEVSSEYEDRLAALRRSYDAERMRNGQSGQAGRDAPGPVQGAGLPGPAGGPDAAAAPGDAIDFNCRANAIQLEELQRWVKEEQAVPR